MSSEELLTGGGVNIVVKIGNTVRRPSEVWSPRVHELLAELRRQGFTGAPEFLGFDEHGREVLTFLAGDVSNYPLTPSAATETALVSAGRLLRTYHDATVDFVERWARRLAAAGA